MAIHKVLRSHQYLDDWLARASSHQACLQHTQELVNNVSANRLAGELREIRAGAQTRLQSYRLPVRPQIRSGLADSRSVAEPSRENAETAFPTGSPGPGIHVLDRFANGYRKQVHLGQLHMRLIQWHHKHNWRVPESLEKVIPNPQVLAPPFTMRAEGRQCPYSPTSTPNKTCSANIYRRINRRVGRSLRRALCKSNLVPSGKQVAYKLSRTLSSFSDFKSSKTFAQTR